MALKFGTIFGAGIGFEIFTTQEFEEAGVPAKWAVMVNLLFFRCTITKL
jgi:hypothetical protein